MLHFIRRAAGRRGIPAFHGMNSPAIADLFAVDRDVGNGLRQGRSGAGNNLVIARQFDTQRSYVIAKIIHGLERRDADKFEWLAHLLVLLGRCIGGINHELYQPRAADDHFERYTTDVIRHVECLLITAATAFGAARAVGKSSEFPSDRNPRAENARRRADPGGEHSIKKNDFEQVQCSVVILP